MSTHIAEREANEQDTRFYWTKVLLCIHNPINPVT